jgi:hypothetical protein
MTRVAQQVGGIIVVPIIAVTLQATGTLPSDHRLPVLR